jgi:hypothetical protein
MSSNAMAALFIDSMLCGSVAAENDGYLHWLEAFLEDSGKDWR